MSSVLFICTGNMCRSPMAEGLLKSALQTYGRADIAVASMGIHAPSGPGNGAARHAVEVCAENGIDISSHLSRQLNFDEMKATDLIFVMEGFQKKVIETFVPQVSDSIFLLGAWPGPEKKNSAIDDPIGGSMKDYRKAFTVIKSHIERILPTLLEQLPCPASCLNRGGHEFHYRALFP